MMLEAKMSYNDDNPEEVKKAKKKKYLWFGYGGYGGSGDTNAFQPVNIRADPGIFDKLFELFGLKEKTKEEPEENKD
jgi:hypothetical protein